MKPAPFEYVAPHTLAEALALLAEHADEAKVLAGGQSLVPSMNFRLALPQMLVDLNGISELAGIEAAENGLRIGAMTRQREVERSPLVARYAPLVEEAMPHIAHPQIRNRGTIGGSIAHADPASELPALAVALGGTMHIIGSRGERTVPASEFFLGIFTTALEPDELLTAIELPSPRAGMGTAFEEFARRHGDYALAGAAAVVYLNNGLIEDLNLVFFSVGDGPIVSASARDVLLGQEPTQEAIRAASEASDADIEPTTDIHATDAYRRHLCRVLARKTLTKAVERARASC